MESFEERLVAVRPAQRQIDWQNLEFTAFFHYGINSFTDREWGNGREDISIIDPKNLDTDQWCASIKKAGIKGCIITAKHHDGFCLWNTAYTDHNVMNTPCRRDIVAELSKSCQKYGIKFGVYLSPWDRHEKTYGLGKPYDDYFCSQLQELLTNYGELYTVWFDGACGEGENGKKQVYDWDRYYRLIRKLQKNAVISVSGPDVRWCGNEAGDCRKAEWSVVSAEVFSQSEIAKRSQQADNQEFRKRRLNEQDHDLGSREVLKNAEKLIWYPAEVDTSIRPGWFYHPSEDGKVRPLEELKNIYLKSAGGNSVLLLNIPPHKDGYISEYDVKRLEELGDFIRTSFSDNLMKDSTVISGSLTKGYRVTAVITDDDEYWQPESPDMPVSLEIRLSKPQILHYCVLKEQIRLGQRVERFVIEVPDETKNKNVICEEVPDGTKNRNVICEEVPDETKNGSVICEEVPDKTKNGSVVRENFPDDKENWNVIYEGETIGYKKICVLPDVYAQKLRIRIMECRKNPAIKFAGLY